MLFVLTTLGFSLYNVIYIYQRYRIKYFGASLSSTINLAIYQKALKYPILANKQYSEGDIINLSQIDAENLTQFGAKAIFCIFGVL